MLPLPEPGPAISPELHQPTAPASGFTFPSASWRESSCNSPGNPGAPQEEGAKLVGLLAFKMVFLIILGLFPLYLVHKTPWIPCPGFIVLPLTPASPLEILGMGLSVKGRRMKDSPLSFPLPGRKHSLDDVGEFLPKKSNSKSLDSLWGCLAMDLPQEWCRGPGGEAEMGNP